MLIFKVCILTLLFLQVMICDTVELAKENLKIGTIKLKKGYIQVEGSCKYNTRMADLSVSYCVSQVGPREKITDNRLKQRL